MLYEHNNEHVVYANMGGRPNHLILDQNTHENCWKIFRIFFKISRNFYEFNFYDSTNFRKIVEIKLP